MTEEEQMYSLTMGEFLSSDLGRPYVNALRAGNTTIGEMVLKSFGQEPTAENLNKVFKAAQGMQTPEELNAEQAKRVRDIMKLDAKDLAIRGLVAGGTEFLHGAGDIAENNGNSLAAAILAANRTNSARQNDIYGPSRREKYAEAWGQERMRRGKNTARILHGIGNVADKVFGMYNNADLAGRSLAAAEIGGKGQVPATTWDYLGRNVTAGKK